MKKLKKTYTGKDKEYRTIYQAYKSGCFDGDEGVIQWRGGRGASVIYRNSRNKVLYVYPSHMSNKEIDFLINCGFCIKVIQYIKISKYQERKIVKNMVFDFTKMTPEDQSHYVERRARFNARCSFDSTDLNVEINNIICWYASRGATIKIEKRP